MLIILAPTKFKVLLWSYDLKFKHHRNGDSGSSYTCILWINLCLCEKAIWLSPLSKAELTVHQTNLLNMRNMSTSCGWKLDHHFSHWPWNKNKHAQIIGGHTSGAYVELSFWRIQWFTERQSKQSKPHLICFSLKSSGTKHKRKTDIVIRPPKNIWTLNVCHEVLFSCTVEKLKRRHSSYKTCAYVKYQQYCSFDRLWDFQHHVFHPFHLPVFPPGRGWSDTWQCSNLPCKEAIESIIIWSNEAGCYSKISCQNIQALSGRGCSIMYGYGLCDHMQLCTKQGDRGTVCCWGKYD